MYSVVLAAMLTAGPAAAPAWGCHGCCGGYSCCGGGCHCCGGYNAFSCCGGGYSCCCGGSYSCCGGYCSGCWGSYYPAYWGWAGYSSCYGCCCGGSYGWPGAYGGYGGCSCCGGGWYRSCAGWAPACSGCCGGYAVATAAAPARVVIKAPLDVHVTVNNQAIDRQAAEQSFTTTDLQPGQTYSYSIQAEAVRDGKTVTRSQTVIVRAGQESRADFGDLTNATGSGDAAPTSGVAHVTITAPADARVTVNGVEVPAASRTFSTPALEPGRTYYYTVTAELTRDGKPVSDSRRVLVAAGQDVSVDFKEAGVATAGK
ncbi:MAG TPA: TIGR03000 domain-containing protein [Gemmataceae bacterium]|nr:TIGR03000 domain-containing protein [Gemmataceae bacterium]